MTPTNSPTRLIRILNLLLVIGIVLLLVNIFWGYGHVDLTGGDGGDLYINQQFVGHNPKSLKLRPGTYSLAFVTPSTAKKTVDIHVRVFGHQTVALNGLPLDLTTPARTATGFTSGSFTFDHAKQFDGVWAAGLVNVPDETDYFVMKYENGQWDKVYLGDGKDVDFPLVIPSDVLAYLRSLPTAGIGGHNGN